MASAFEVAHRNELQGSLTTVDRLIVHGHLSRLWFPNHMAYFLNRLGVHIACDFGRFVKEASSKVIARGQGLAKKAGRPFIYQDRVVHGKDDGFERYENTFLKIEDLPLAQRLGAAFARRRWTRLFDAFARRINPWLSVIREKGFGSYYWCIDACEVSTDLMWHNRPRLLNVLDDLFDYALRAFSADDVVRFLGLRHRPKTGDLETRHARRPEGRRIKHRVRQNWLKLYDKWSVLRIETVINNPSDFRVLRFEQDLRGGRRGLWKPMRKGIHNLWRYVQIGEGINRRYLDALAEVKPTAPAVAQLDSLCRPRSHNGQHFARFNPVARPDAEFFQAVLSGTHLINGFSNRDLQNQLWSVPPTNPIDAHRRCRRVCRLIRKLRGHALLAKVQGRRRYRVTLRGRRLLAAALHYRKRAFPHALAA